MFTVVFADKGKGKGLKVIV